jgi:hypothetical protein
MLRQDMEKIYKADARKFLTFLAPKLQTMGMARYTDVVDALKQQLAQDGERVLEINKEIAKLRSSYNRFRDLTEEAKTKTARMLTTRTLLGDAISKNELTEAFLDELSALGTSEELRAKLNLWEAVVEILRHVPQAQVGEIHTALDVLNIRTTRQAIESAIATHKHLFRVRKHGREKFISLAD